MLSEELVDIATRHQVYLERLKAGELKKTDALFARLNLELARTLSALPTTSLGILSLIQRARLLQEIEKNHQEAYQEHLQKIVVLLRGVAEFSHEFEIESLNEVTEDTVEPQTDNAAPPLWATVQEQPMGHTGVLLAGWLGAWMANEISRGTALARRAISEGWTASRLITAYRGTAVNRYEDGLFASARRNTRSTLNTAVQHASVTARVHAMNHTSFQPAGQPVKTDSEGRVTSIPRRAAAAAERARIRVGDNIRLLGYRWVSILDNATTQICRSLDGQVFKFNQGPLPPAHVGCRSSIIGELSGRWLKRMPNGRFAPRPSRTATGAGGTVTVNGGTTYYEWLRTQPEDFQNDALGLTRATLFRKGGMSAATFAKLNLGRNFHPLTLDEMRRLKPNAFRRAGL